MFHYKNTSRTKQDTELKPALLKSLTLIHQNKWKKYYSFQEHFWTRSKRHNFPPLTNKKWFFMQQLVPELQWKLWTSKMLSYIRCWIIVNLLSTGTPRSRYYIPDHISNYNKCLVSHFWQALIFQKTLICIKYLKNSSFSFQIKINKFHQRTDASSFSLWAFSMLESSAISYIVGFI